MKNYLIYLDCYTEERINQCRFALLKYLAVYNLIPPANISVIVYTNKVALFDVFDSFYKDLEIVENNTPMNELEAASLHEGTVLVSSPAAYLYQPVDELFINLALRNNAPIQRHQKTGSDPVLAFITDGQQQTTPVPISFANYFTSYKTSKDLSRLLQAFFKRNEEESIPNLVKKVHHLNADVIQKEIETQNKAPLLQRVLRYFKGTSDIVKRYQNKL